MYHITQSSGCRARFLSPIVAAMCLFSLLSTLLLVIQASPFSNPEPLNLGGEWLMGIECMSDEFLARGKLKECEPTCKEPRPPCLKMYYTSLDFYPCFCKEPLVRDTSTNKCVELSDCPVNKTKTTNN